MYASNASKNEYVEKLLPTKIVIRTRFPENWNSESFRKTIWERINIRIPKGKCVRIVRRIKRLKIVLM